MPVCNRCYQITDDPCRNDTETMDCPRLTRQPKKKELTMTNEEKALELKKAFKVLRDETKVGYVHTQSQEAMDLCDAEPDSAARVYDILKGLGGVK